MRPDNPEPIINAVLLALEAQRSAFLTNILLTVLIGVGTAIVIALILLLLHAKRIDEHLAAFRCDYKTPQ